MKIRSVEGFPVPLRWLFVKITTQSGIVGWGELVVEGKAATVATCRKWAAHWARCGRNRRRYFKCLPRQFLPRRPGFDQRDFGHRAGAVGDIKGKYHNLPVYAFWRCARDRVEVYRWIGGDHPARRGAARRPWRTLFGEDERHRRIEVDRSLRDAGRGWNAWRLCAKRWATSCAWPWTHGRACTNHGETVDTRTETFRLMFVEEPVLCENEEVFAELARTCHIPIATGERNYTRWGFKNMLMRGGVDILQPDVSHAGGIWETRKIAAMAEAFDVAVAPHCPLGPIALASCLQVDFCSPNAIIQEQSLNIHYNVGYDLLKYIKNPEVFHYENGYVHLLREPGLGVEVDEDYVREMAMKGHDWHNPIWRDADGCVTEW